jgi:hypothetical protein
VRNSQKMDYAGYIYISPRDHKTKVIMDVQSQWIFKSDLSSATQINPPFKYIILISV